ncbi:MAG: Gfo/Idh/MocA family oxidoreductase [Planctomycetia bacterium]|nr:Gfo/Idh/MocA family oxidoreductase [Planctomycetia bacterium]
MKTVKIAILGVGSIGKVHLYAYQTLPFYLNPLPVKPEIKYVVNSRPETAAEAASLTDRAIPLTDWNVAIQDPEIDVVNICLPNHLHFPVLKAAILANKNIYCEKPILLNAAEADEIEPLLTNYRGISQVTFHTRFFASAMKMKEMIEAGKIGDILEFRGSYLQNSHVDPTRPSRWKNLKAAGGGALTDIGSHLLDFTDWLAGPLTETFFFDASSDPQNSERAEDSIVMLWKTQNGAIGSLHVSKMAHGTENDMTLEIFGRRGALRFTLDSPHYLEYFDGQKSTSPFGGESGWIRIPVGNRYSVPDTDFPAAKSGIGWVRAHCTSMAHFLRNIAAGKILNDEPDLRRGIYVQRLMEKCRKFDA